MNIASPWSMHSSVFCRLFACATGYTKIDIAERPPGEAKVCALEDAGQGVAKRSGIKGLAHAPVHTF